MAKLPDLPQEIFGLILDNIYTVRDLLNCMCVNLGWYGEVARRLYRGSLLDMKYRTPSIAMLGSLFVSSNKRFAHNMGFVKHLMLAPESPTAGPQKLACFEMCRALSDHKHAELFLQEGRPISIIILFNIANQDPRALLKLLHIPTVEYMAIDNTYSNLLVDSAFYTRQNPLPEKFSNIKALTIYGSKFDEDIDHLDRLLDRCDLQFFHFTVVHQSEPAASNKDRFSQCLGKQKNLKALSLQICCYGVPLTPAKSTRETNEKLWPGLKALDLLHAKQDWVKQCPKFEDLQILRLRFREGETIDWKCLAKCGNLRVFDISVAEVSDLDMLLDVANGCPLLQKFSVQATMYVSPPEEPSGPFFSSLAGALPLLEVLSLNLALGVDGTALRDLSQCCPRLIILDLPLSVLDISLFGDITSPFRNLETVLFGTIVFEDLEFMTRHEIDMVACEWERVFPRLRTIPCDDRFNIYEDMGEESDGDDSSGHDEDLPLSDEDNIRESEEDDEDMSEHDDDGFTRRIKIWAELCYTHHSPTNRRIHNRIHDEWQAKLEIATVGWPVMRERIFSAPHYYCSTIPKGVFR